MTKNVYIHIPFCSAKCKYCSFISFPKIDLKQQYLDVLKQEIKYFYKGEKLSTLYFGGGTPSVLSPSEFLEIISLFNIDENTEITSELNPENISENYLKELKNTGINRISFGCQTFDDEILKLIGRRHNSKDVENSVKYAKNVGFENISLDFIYGLPNQTLEMFEKDLNHAISLGINHISLYGLKIDEGCYFYKNMPKNLPDEDIQADMYLSAIKICKENNFEHYEVSNFSKKGFNSRHNLNYWDNNSYYGFGVSAHGYQNGCRYFNTSDLDKYLKNPFERENSHKLSTQEQLEEEIFLGFRKGEGINIEEINKKFDINFEERYSKILKKYPDLLCKTQKGYKLSDDGILVSNLILSEFLD